MEHRITRTHRTGPRAVVVGGGVSGLLAAKDLAAAGYRVRVLEAATVWGGCVGVHEVAGVSLDSGAESFATRSTAVADLAAELGLADAIETPHPSGAWVWLPEGPVPLPRTGLLGIPSDVHAPEVRAALGRAGVLRAALDARMPASVGTSGAVCSVAELVRARMGRRVLERLVAPVVGGVHSADPELLDIDMVAPGLRAGIREHGSLAAAVAAQRSAGAGAKAGSAVAGLAGGMNTLVSALVAHLRAAGVELDAGHTVTRISRPNPGHEPAADGGTPARWQLAWAAGPDRDARRDARREDRRAPGGRAATGSAATGSDARSIATGSAEADLLVLAVDGPTAVKLLADELPELLPLAPAPGPDIRLVTLVVDVPELDSRPRGTGILVAPQVEGIQAKALTHATAKWDWLAGSTGPGTHVLRLSYGRAGVAAADAVRRTAPVGDGPLIATALTDATKLLGVEVTDADVLGADVVRWRGALPFAAVGHRAKMQQVREIAARAPGLLLLGGWLSGNGLAAVVADTRRQLAALPDAAQPR
ncbi:protoporphyrinogen/coproporphyrinogen oxidase [Specibacter sp. RAF43]|uniref:protoporphyrinogen/coproporphyrinogen oxidase n=1 Tax=Specibacter sp. RAF43 TaxID=3233057 RepID=UPI003F9A65F0